MPTAFGKVVGTAGIRHISPYDEQISAGSLSGDLTNGPITVDGNDLRVRTITQNLVDASLTVDFKMAGADAYVRFFGRNLANIHTTTAAFTVAARVARGEGKGVPVERQVRIACRNAFRTTKLLDRLVPTIGDLLAASGIAPPVDAPEGQPPALPDVSSGDAGHRH